MSTTIVAVFVQLLTIILPMFGLSIGSAELTGTIQTLVLIVTGLWIWIRRVRVGDVGVMGARK